MESSEREPSYYEVALTNRQVMVAFVVLLACLVAAFLAGVWFGQAGEPSSGRSAAAETGSAVTTPDQKLEKLTFFNEDKGTTPAAQTAPAAVEKTPSALPASTPEAAPPPAATPAPAETEADKLRRTIEAEMNANRDAVPESSSRAAPGTRVKRTHEEKAQAKAARSEEASPKTAALPAEPAPAAASGGSVSAAAANWIQVYSSSNGSRARELAANLRGNGFATKVLETSVGGGTTYRVRVGPYDTREKADLAAARLRREFRLDTWVTDQP